MIEILTIAGPIVGLWLLFGDKILAFFSKNKIELPKFSNSTCLIEDAAKLARQFEEGSKERDFIVKNIAPQLFDKIVTENDGK